MAVASEASKRYVLGAHALGLTVAAIIEDLYTHGSEHVMRDDIGDILKDNGQFPKLTYLWHNWIVKATNGPIPTGIYPWNSWSGRFILNSKAKDETNSTVFANMRKRGSEIPGEYWIKVVLDEHRFIENELARGCDTSDNAALQNIIVMAHNWGYTLSEIARRIFRSTNKSTSAVNTDMVRMALESNGIPEAEHRNSRKFGVVAREFVLSAYILGMDVDSIRDRMYVHGFDHSDPKPVLKLLKRKGIWQGQKLEQARPSQVAPPTQPRTCESVRPGEGQVAARSVLADEEPGGRIYVRDLLN